MLGITTALIALLAAAVLVLLLYLLKERFRTMVISYLPLWELTLKKTPATTLLRNFRRIFSYLLQVLIILLLIFSITEMGYGKNRQGRRIAVLIDTSTSMASTDLEPSRFARAVEFTKKIGDSMQKNDRALVIQMSQSPKVVRSWTDSPEAVTRAVDELKLSYGGNDFVSSLKLSAAALEGTDASEKEIWVLSDGAYDPSEEKKQLLKDTIIEIRKKGIKILHHKPGKDSTNLAISRFSVRQNLREKLKLSANIVIDTFDQEKTDGKGTQGKQSSCESISLQILSGGDTVVNRTIEKDQFGRLISIDIPAPANRVLEARIAPGGKKCPRDFLSVDDSAKIMLPRQLMLKILAITNENTYLMAALLLSPLWNVEIIGEGEQPSSDTYDVVVADGGQVPAHVKRKGTLYIKPQFDGFPLQAKGVVEAPVFEDVEYSHPALRWTNLYNVNIAQAFHYEPRKGDSVLASSHEAPLVIEMKEEGRSDLVMAFSISDTDMPLRTTWPLFFINTLYYLSGTTMQVSSASNSPQESNITSRWLPKAQRIEKAPQAVHVFPLWIILIIAALLLNMVEWLSFHRRWTV
ncbi:MAG: VWA domain-containing protein [Pseudomonadota bacterium]